MIWNQPTTILHIMYLSFLFVLDYSKFSRIEIYFWLNYFISLLQSSSYKNQDYANDEVCLFHLFFASLPAIPCSHAMEREGIARSFVFQLFSHSRSRSRFLLSSLSKFVFGFYVWVGLGPSRFLRLRVFCSGHHTHIRTHTHLTHTFHALAHPHPTLTHTQTDRQTYRTSRDFDNDLAAHFICLHVR